MAEIVMGIGTSHGSQVSLTPEWWVEHGKLDRDRTNYQKLLDGNQGPNEEELSLDAMQAKYDRVQAALGTLGDFLETSSPDVLVVVGDDQSEMYKETQMPAVAVYWGDTVWDLPRDLTNVPESRKAAMWAKHAEVAEEYPVAAALGRHIIETTIANGFDTAQIQEQPKGRSLGHAFTFVRLRLMRDRIIPMVPIMLNTYFPPNQPTAARCLDFGKAIGEAVKSWPESVRVGVVASGGLSHFVVDEKLDRRVLNAIRERDDSDLSTIPEEQLQSGSSEIKNWIVAAGASQDLPFSEIEYVPGYRTEAGTGCGMAFGVWGAIPS